MDKQRRRSAWEESRAALYSAKSIKEWLKALDTFLNTPEFSVKKVEGDKHKWVRVRESIHDKLDLTRDSIAQFDAEVASVLNPLYDTLESGLGPILFSSKASGHKFLADVVKMQIAVDAHDKPLYGFVFRFVQIAQELEF